MRKLDWKLCHGHDENDLFHYGSAVFGCILMPLSFIILTGYICWLFFNPPPGRLWPDPAGWYLIILAIPAIWMLWRYLGSGFWFFEKYRLSPEGIHLKWLFGRRTVPWNSIQAAAIYDVFYFLDSRPRKFILAFLDVKKRPRSLMDDSIYLKRKFTVLIRATEESIKEFESYRSPPLIEGRQNGAQWMEQKRPGIR